MLSTVTRMHSDLGHSLGTVITLSGSIKNEMSLQCSVSLLSPTANHISRVAEENGTEVEEEKEEDEQHKKGGQKIIRLISFIDFV